MCEEIEWLAIEGAVKNTRLGWFISLRLHQFDLKGLVQQIRSERGRGFWDNETERQENVRDPYWESDWLRS